MTVDSQGNLATTISSLREQAVTQLDKYVRERGHREQMRLMLVQDNHKIFIEQFLQSYNDLTDKQVEQDFMRLFARGHDGVIRNRPDRFDIENDTGVYIGKSVDVTLEIKRRVVSARVTCQRLGPAWRARFQNSYVTMPENIMVIFWPEIPWCENAGPALNIPDEEFGCVADIAHNPERSHAWTDPFYDHVAKVWMVSCETPIDIDMDEPTSGFENQAHALSETSVPVTQLWDKVLLLPVVGFLDDQRAQAMMQAGLSNIAKARAHVLIHDISGSKQL